MEPTKKRILIVEDEATTLMPITNALEQAGYTVLQAHDGQEGLTMAKAEHPDLILADLKMPNMNGLEMIAELRKDSWGKDAQIIITTNTSDVATVQEAMTHGAFFYVVKSETSMKEIVNMIELRVGKSAA
ncbi:MAG: response regulator [Patescibacteria group bacterium]